MSKDMEVPKDTVSIYAELKGSCYEEERYCNSFSPTDRDMVEHFWNNPKVYLCIALDENGNDIGNNQG
jgi:hypothetical protein